jgi:hypothetical protein
MRRQDGQASKGELSARDLKLELEAKERAAARKRCVAFARVPDARGPHTQAAGTERLTRHAGCSWHRQGR